MDAGQASWPAVQVEREVVERFVARHALDDAPGPHDADLFLACACAAGVTSALAVFEHELLAQVGFISRISAAAPFVEEVQQQLRERLLVGEAKIGEYAGRGPLGGWLRVAATRLALDLAARRREEPAPRDGLLERLADAGDPEIELLRRRYVGELEVAIRAAVEELTTRERTLLRLQFADGLGIERIRYHLQCPPRDLRALDRRRPSAPG
jgi:RNA polymerase sigma-70 factor (ECF subfamily)